MLTRLSVHFAGDLTQLTNLLSPFPDGKTAYSHYLHESIFSPEKDPEAVNWSSHQQGAVSRLYYAPYQDGYLQVPDSTVPTAGVHNKGNFSILCQLLLLII
uniref:Uncharacterized protein n=1 Tax=Anguilla anguilla TaxID=7936 RepID=A0A0E9XQM5_ANGAN